MIGQTIRDFEILRRLGSGGMGEVWIAEHQIIHTRVAIKVLREEISTQQQHVQRFFNEAIAAGKIKHAGIVDIFDVGFRDGRAFLIMELLEGETLSARIARAGRLPAGMIAEIGRQIASILDATHAEGIVHRDLKPDNVFLVPDAELASRERVKVLDFGIAKLGGGLTGAGDTMGTPAYMAPEQWSHAAAVDGRADVYSLGCVVYEMCCGRPPFQAESIAQAYAKHRDEPPPRARALAPELPAELDELIARMLAKAPAERPAVREIGAAFARLAASQPGALDATLAPDGAASGSEAARAPSQRPPAAPASADRAAPRGAASDEHVSSGSAGAGAVTTLGGAAGMASAPSPERPRRGRFALALGLGAAGAAAAAIAVYVGTRGTDGTAAAPPSGTDAAPSSQVAAAAGSSSALAPADAASSDTEAAPANRWIRIDPPPAPYLLGLPDDAPAAQVGLRASRGIATPSQPYELQEHEVTWSELEPWLASSGERVALPAAGAATRARLPATGIPWSLARAYCRSLGGELPTEEQWEYAARGPSRRPHPWGAEPLDLQMTRAFAGPDAAPSPVMTSPQDATPAAGGARLWDLAGNAQEWTLGLWREDRAGLDESDVQRGQTTARALRGLPLTAPPPDALPAASAVFRKRLCATGPCVEKTRALLASVGFRCARPVAR